MSDISFFRKENIKCLVCMGEFPKEEMRTGGGRLIAKDITIELRREYKITEKYGRISPLVFGTVTCPHCFFSSFGYDFNRVLDHKGLDVILKKQQKERMDKVRELVPMVNFTRNRTHFEGVGGYFLATMCYEHYPSKSSPTIKQAIASLRAAWLCNDLDEDIPENGYDRMADRFYRQSLVYYEKAMALEETGEQSVSNAPTLGPDTDNNYGFDGALYMYMYLYQKYGSKENVEERVKKLQSLKFSISKIFGMGKKSASKPVVILDRIKAVFDEINKELAQIEKGN